MNKLIILLVIGFILSLATAGYSLVVVDDDFEGYNTGSYIADQGSWTGIGGPNGPSVRTTLAPATGKAGRWLCFEDDNNSDSITNTFEVEWKKGSAVMYIDVAMNAVDGPGNFSYFSIFDSSNVEATRIYLRRGAGTTGDIHVLGRSYPGDPNPYLPNIVVDPANNVFYKLKLEIDITNKKYDCYVGDGDRSGENPGHWGYYNASNNLVLDGTPAANDVYFYYGATGLYKFNWQMYHFSHRFNGNDAYAYCDNVYIEGPDGGDGMRSYEIWVAQGTYNEKVTLNQFANLYGGFAGNETSKADRNSLEHPTVINAGSTAVGDSAVTGANNSSVEGFILRGGYYGVDSNQSSIEIRNNIIKDNLLAGVLGDGDTAKVTNNTIVNNNIGISCPDGASIITNNIITSNSIGISSTGGAPVLSHNDVVSNTAANYSGLSAGPTDISAAPKFANAALGDYHLLLESPCIDAGDSGMEFVFDKSGGFRPVDGDGDGLMAFDIGAYENQLTPLLTVLPGVKTTAGETIVRCERAIISAAWTDFFYIESDDRFSGIRVDIAGHGLDEGMRADIVGTLKTNSDGELYIDAAVAKQNGEGSVTPIGLVGKLVGGSSFFFDSTANVGQKGTSAYRILSGGSLIENVSGLSNIGLLVSIWGNVKWAPEANAFYVNDGSGYSDGNPSLPGIRVIVPDGVNRPAENGFVKVTGISSCFKVSERLHRLIRVRTVDDIVDLD